MLYRDQAHDGRTGAEAQDVLAQRELFSGHESDALLRIDDPMLIWLGAEHLLLTAVSGAGRSAAFLAARISSADWQRFARSAMTLEAAFLASRERGEVWLVRDYASTPLLGRRLAEIPSGWLPEASTLEELGVRVEAVTDTRVVISANR